MILDEKVIHSKNTFSVFNPYTKKEVGKVVNCSSDQIAKALESAFQTPPPPAKERAGILNRFASEVERQRQDIARMITSESGLCLKDTLREVGRAVETALDTALVAKQIDNDISRDYDLRPQSSKPILKVITEPLDLVIGITPFNHPFNQVAHKVLPAIAAGACMVLKPSSKTPLSAIRLAKILTGCGLEKNMLHIVTGILAEQIVDQLVSYRYLDMVTFTGGSEAGAQIVKMMVAAGNGLKKYVPELGGCSSLIVCDDADLQASSKVAIEGCFGNSGQRCTAIRRLVVLQKVADKFLEIFASETKKLKCGDPFDVETDIGTVISEEAAREIQSRVRAAIRDGARLIVGDQRDGAFYSPTILDHVKLDSVLVTQETFGPVAAIIRVKTVDEAIRIANQTNYRLAGAVMTRSRKIAEKVSNSLLVGQFNWNGPPGYRTEAAPFGGFKGSGNGEKEGVVNAAYAMRRIRTFYEH